VDRLILLEPDMIKIATLPVATRDARERIQRRMCGAAPASLTPASLISGLNMRKLLPILVISCWATVAHAQKADLIVTNAKIVTLDPASTIAQALAVRDGKIVAIGGNDAMEGLIGITNYGDSALNDGPEAPIKCTIP
jgi:hypothetical protein